MTSTEASTASAEDSRGEHPTKRGEAANCHSLSYAYSTYLRHDEEESNHWSEVCRSFRQYASFAMAQYANHQYRLHALPEAQRRVLPAALRLDTDEFHERAKLYKEAAIRNQFCLDCILRHAGQPHSQEYQSAPSGGGATETATASTTTAERYSSDAQMSKVSSVLKSLARDWSAQGKPERDMAYGPIFKALEKYLPVARPSSSRRVAASNGSRSPPKLCVPGAGVGRLSFELSARGYTVQGNEFSLFMLLASDFILNGGMTNKSGQTLNISPWLLESRNVHSSTDPTRIIQIPDTDPLRVLQRGQDSRQEQDEAPDTDSLEEPRTASTTSSTAPADFSMAAGEFLSIYSHPKERSQWDGVIACFFLDASPSVVEYIQVIYQMLRPGGLLVNFGPLLWHWSGPAMRPDDQSVEEYQDRFSHLDERYLSSVDFCWEDVKEILINVGFEMVEERTGNPAVYTADRRSMMNMNYRCVSFVARKKDQPPAIVGSGVSTDK